MKKRSIKWRIFKYNLFIIFTLIAFTTIIFNVAVRKYIEKDVLQQLNKIASNTEDTALQHGPDFFPEPKDTPPPDKKPNDDIYRYYFMLDNSLKEPLTVLNSDFILLDKDKNRIDPRPEKPSNLSPDFLNKITKEITNTKNFNGKTPIYIHSAGTKYIAIIKPVSDKNSFGLGWIIIYSSLKKVNELQLVINIILLAILLLGSLISIFFASRASKKISEPFSSLNQYLKAIAGRNFGCKIQMPVYDELQEFVLNINVMSEKLQTYDKSQKTFLQNVSHEFRTPLMSIQSYAEGIKYEVVDSDSATNVILDETIRMTNLVEDLLYLSRLDAIEENDNFVNLDLNELVASCVNRMAGIAAKNNITINLNFLSQTIEINADHEKLSRAINNIISNCIQYAKSMITVTLKLIDTDRLSLIISDDGPGFENHELPVIFERFYKGKKGNFGLGLSISKNIIEKLNGTIYAENLEYGASFTIELPFTNAS